MKKEIKGFVSSTKRADGFYFFSSIQEEAGDLPATLIIHEPEQRVEITESQALEVWDALQKQNVLSFNSLKRRLGFKVELGK